MKVKNFSSNIYAGDIGTGGGSRNRQEKKYEQNYVSDVETSDDENTYKFFSSYSS